MTNTDPRTLKPGQRVRITKVYEGTVYDPDGEGRFCLDSDTGWVTCSNPEQVTSVEVLPPPLPTEVGTTIVARLAGTVRIPRVLALGLRNGRPAWFIAGESVCTSPVDPKDITEWALLDGVHTVPAPEPPCLFANEHKRWSQYPAILHPQERVEWGGITGTLVECSRCGPGHLLLDPDEEQYGTEPEAPLPTEITSLILAKIRSAPEPYLLSLGSQNAKPTWFVAGCLPIRSVSADLIEDWVQIDPETLRPVGDPS